MAEFHRTASFKVVGLLPRTNHLSHSSAHALDVALNKRLDATSRLALAMSDDVAEALDVIFTDGTPADVQLITRMIGRHAAGVAHRIHSRTVGAVMAERCDRLGFEDAGGEFDPDVAMDAIDWSRSASE